MKREKARRFISCIVALVMAVSLAVPAMAAESNSIHLESSGGWNKCDFEFTGVRDIQTKAEHGGQADYYVYMDVNGTIEALGEMAAFIPYKMVGQEPGANDVQVEDGSGVYTVLQDNGTRSEENEMFGTVFYQRAGYKIAMSTPGNYTFLIGLAGGQGPSHSIVVYVGNDVPATPVAHATSYKILVDGEEVSFDSYALKDEKGNDTNYLKLRDVASVLNGTSVQFNVGFDGSINIVTGEAYQPNGSEMSTPFSGDQPYKVNTNAVKVNGEAVTLDAILLTDEHGSGYTYFKLRDLGSALGFGVDWDGKNILISTFDDWRQPPDDMNFEEVYEAVSSYTDVSDGDRLLTELWTLEDYMEDPYLSEHFPENAKDLYITWRMRNHPFLKVSEITEEEIELFEYVYNGAADVVNTYYDEHPDKEEDRASVLENNDFMFDGELKVLDNLSLSDAPNYRERYMVWRVFSKAPRPTERYYSSQTAKSISFNMIYGINHGNVEDISKPNEEVQKADLARIYGMIDSGELPEFAFYQYIKFINNLHPEDNTWGLH